MVVNHLGKELERKRPLAAYGGSTRSDGDSTVVVNAPLPIP